ncbi:MAG: AmmeMemoRadiSam system protein A [archaeon]
MARTASTERKPEGGLSKKGGKFLLELARRSIQNYFDKGEQLDFSENELPSKRLAEKGASFVTLTIRGELRGCIGMFEAVRPLFQDVIENAVQAAFGDPRFSQLRGSEFSEVKIEVSVLTPPRYSSAEEVTRKKSGAIISFRGKHATFLPQVWKELPEKEEFFSHLCLKAGLNANAWKENGFKVRAYEVRAFRE